MRTDAAYLETNILTTSFLDGVQESVRVSYSGPLPLTEALDVYDATTTAYRYDHDMPFLPFTELRINDIVVAECRIVRRELEHNPQLLTVRFIPYAVTRLICAPRIHALPLYPPPFTDVT